MSKLATALLEFQKNAPSLHSDAANSHFNNKYLSLAGLMGAIRPVLNANGLVLMQFPTQIGGQPALRTKLLHAESGECEEDTMPLMLAKNDPQAQGSGLTYGRRYAAMAILGLVADEDDDGNGASRPQRSDGATGDGTTPVHSSPAGAATKPPAPSGTFAPPPAVRDELDRKAAGSVPPGDGGVPEQVVMPFGKHSGSSLGDLLDSDLGYVKWLASEKFEPKNKDQRRVKGAAMTVLGEPVPAGAAVGPDDDIPFAVTI